MSGSRSQPALGWEIPTFPLALPCTQDPLGASLFFFFPPWDSVSPSKRTRQDNSETYRAIKCPMSVQDAPSTFRWHILRPLSGTPEKATPPFPRAPARLFLNPGNQRGSMSNCELGQMEPSHLCYLKPLPGQRPSGEAGRAANPAPVGVRGAMTLNSPGLRDLQHQLPLPFPLMLPRGHLADGMFCPPSQGPRQDHHSLRGHAAGCRVSQH